MAKCFAECIGSDSTREKIAHRLGSRSAEGRAQTWHTFAKAVVYADGSGYISVERDGVEMFKYEFLPEDSPRYDDKMIER